MTIALAALSVARAELARGVREEPLGSNRGACVDRYLALCIRDARRIWRGVSALPSPGPSWCAAFVSWCVWVAAMGDDLSAQWTAPWSPDGAAKAGDPPIGYRAGVHELVEDARATGALRDRSEVPQVGWLAIFGREHESPLHGGRGHVGFVESLDGDLVNVLGGNQGAGLVSIEPRNLGDVLAWIAL